MCRWCACLRQDDRIRAFVRLLMKIPEHTYGLPGINDDFNYTNAEFAAAYGEPAIQNALSSYTEQRTIAMEYGMDALADHPLRQRIASAWQAMTPQYPDTAGKGLLSWHWPCRGKGDCASVVGLEL